MLFTLVFHYMFRHTLRNSHSHSHAYTQDNESGFSIEIHTFLNQCTRFKVPLDSTLLNNSVGFALLFYIPGQHLTLYGFAILFFYDSNTTFDQQIYTL